MKKNKINVLVNSSGWFYSSIALLKQKALSMDVAKMKQYGIEFAIDFNFIKFTDIDFLQNDYSGQYFLYTSSEDPNLLYKSYIQDIMQGLRLQGAILIPELDYLMAHSNKVYMEILRDIILRKVDTGIQSKVFGDYESYKEYLERASLPFVAKTASGAGSKGVVLIRNQKEARSKILKLSRSFDLKLFIKNAIGRPAYYNLHRNKFIVQNFVSNLDGDYKILVYGDKYYVLNRKVRSNDFRASGSGKFDFDCEVDFKILDFAKEVYDALDVPIASLDIAYDGDRCYLIEFQCLNFGTKTIEASERYFMKEENVWSQINAKSILEKEFVLAIKKFIDN